MIYSNPHINHYIDIDMKSFLKYLPIIFLFLVGLSLSLKNAPALASGQSELSIYLPIIIDRVFINPGFEEGSIGWELQSNQGDNMVTTTESHAGLHSAALGNGASHRIASLSQVVTVPFDSYAVSYYQKITSTENCPSKNVVNVYINTHIYQHYNICSDSSSTDWVKKVIYLAPYTGQRVIFRLQFASSDSSGNHIYVDDFAFESP